ncbi:MAG: recombination mediator RecR [Synergistaceae bacterium]|nr:recombination mediator RecR [Synergistaceae bacterium]
MSLPGPLELLINLWGKFPGVGNKTARRMVFFLLSQNPEWARSLARAVNDVMDQVRSCSECGAVTTEDICSVCSDPARDRKTICVVETQEDCVAMEQSGVYRGLYHILGGRCSPLDDEEIPEESLEQLKRRIRELCITEIILALDPRVEGDLTAFTLQDALSGTGVRLSRLSYGLPVGGSIGYADRATLHVALESRREMEKEEE